MKRLGSCIVIVLALSMTHCASHKPVTAQPAVMEDNTAVNEGRDGMSFDQAIKVNNIREEYQWVAAHHQSLTLKQQSLQFKDKKPYDVLTFTRTNGSEQRFYFDISNFYGKF
jgi:hypothetical protein